MRKSIVIKGNRILLRTPGLEEKLMPAFLSAGETTERFSVRST